MAVAAPVQMSQAGNVAGTSMEEWATSISAGVGPATRLGPFDKVHVF